MDGLENMECEIEATVPSGFESTAQMEAKEKLGIDVGYERGKLLIKIPVADVEQVKQLQSVDNMYIILKRYKKFSFSQDLVEALVQTSKLIPEINWELGMLVWRKFIQCNVPHSGKPQENWQDKLSDITDRVKGQYGENGSVKPAAPAVSATENGEPARKKARLEHDPTMPCFRATCWRAGRGHCFQSQQAASVFGGAVQDYFGWNVKLKDYDVEVVLDIVDDNVAVGVALTKESKHRRHITKFGPTTLRPTIAYGLLRLSKIQDCDVVCDPMCGGGSIPIEAAVNWPRCSHWAGDNDERAVARAQENITALNSRANRAPLKIQLARWDVTQMPFKDESVDVFVSDLPFGKRSGSKMRNWHLYPKALCEMARVARRGSGRACLLTQDRKCMLKSLSSVRAFWLLLATVPINIGGLQAAVYVLNRSSASHTAEAAQQVARTMQSARVLNTDDA